MLSAGAHVLLQHPSDRGDAPAEADLQSAADLAAFFSKVCVYGGTFPCIAAAMVS